MKLVRFVVPCLAISVLLGSLLAACGVGVSTSFRGYLASHQAELYSRGPDNAPEVRFTVDPGTPARAIGDDLFAAGLIRDPDLFEAYVRVNKLVDRLEAGIYLLSASMTMVEIVDALQYSAAQVAVVTIREGWRYEQSADYLLEIDLFGDRSEGRSFQVEEYLRHAKSVDTDLLSRYPFLSTPPEEVGLEGYLFPDTYQLPLVDAGGYDLLTLQLDAFGDKVVPLYNEAVNAGRTMLSLHAVLTLAAIVEREAVIAAERPSIAGVYLNRLAVGMKLEADPTVQYAMGYQAAGNVWWKRPVFLEEYGSVISPYNTYLNEGLPPGPIAAPGLDSIRAVLVAEEHEYLYFVALPDGSGAHRFARTFEEHKLNVERYLRGN